MIGGLKASDRDVTVCLNFFKRLINISVRPGGMSGSSLVVSDGARGARRQDSEVVVW